MADVFLSYAREDRQCAEKLAHALAERGWTVWWDGRIQVGRSFSETIERELDAARCVIVLWSHASVGSDWVHSEAAEGAARKVLIPIRIEDVRIPLEFRRLHTADLLDWRRSVAGPEFDECMRSVETLVGKPRREGSQAIAPAPEPPKAGSRPRKFRLTVVGLVALLVGTVIIFGVQRRSVERTAVPPATAATHTASSTSSAPTNDSSAVDREVARRIEAERARFDALNRHHPVVDLDTGAGAISIELFPDLAPNHVRAFIDFIKGGSLAGARLETRDRSLVLIGVDRYRDRMRPERSSLRHERSALAMTLSAHAAICLADVPSLDGKTTVFGKVVRGMDVIDRVTSSEPVNILEATVTVN